MLDITEIHRDITLTCYLLQITFTAKAGQPVKLEPETIPATPTVSNTQRNNSRILVKSLKLQLKVFFINCSPLALEVSLLNRFATPSLLSVWIQLLFRFRSDFFKNDFYGVRASIYLAFSFNCALSTGYCKNSTTGSRKSEIVFRKSVLLVQEKCSIFCLRYPKLLVSLNQLWTFPSGQIWQPDWREPER